MSEKNQIVDNPLLLTSLYSQGIFHIHSSQNEPALSSKKIENQEVNDQQELENKKIILPESTVIHLIYDKHPSHWPEYLNEPLSKIMSAVKIEGKSIPISDYAVYNLTLMPEVKDITKFIAELNTKLIMLWSSNLKIQGWEGVNHEYIVANKKVLWLKDIQIVMSAQTEKIEAWTSMKKFFNMP